jgi:hypothetical protein
MPTQAKRAMRIVLAHDWLCGYRGGEGVLDRLVQVVSRHHELVDLFVMFDDDGSVSPAIDATPRTVSKVGKWPLASGPLRRWLMPFYPKAIRDLSRKLDALHERGVPLLEQDVAHHFGICRLAGPDPLLQRIDHLGVVQFDVVRVPLVDHVEE